MKPPRFIFYKPRIRSFRGWVLTVQVLWIVLVNAVTIVEWIILAVVWLLWMLLVALPSRLVDRAVNHKRAVNLSQARDEMRRYQDGR
jgi:hypothetical protein